jgi:ABC-2 type transport system permease protein
MLLGYTVLFLFDWLFACLGFYTTEAWGLAILRNGVATFFGGALIPLALFPGPIQTGAGLLPFGQAIYVPVALLGGITPPHDLGRIFLVQLAWLAGLTLASRLVFRRAIRRLSIQGG